MGPGSRRTAASVATDIGHDGRSARGLATFRSRVAGGEARLSGDMGPTLAWIAAVVVAAWGVAHAIPTRAVVAGFEPVSADNRWVILQERVAEAVTMWGLAALVAVATVTGGPGSATTPWVYRAVAGLLVALAVLTALTGARTPVVWFKICPVLLGFSAALLVVASLLA